MLLSFARWVTMKMGTAVCPCPFWSTDAMLIAWLPSTPAILEEGGHRACPPPGFKVVLAVDMVNGARSAGPTDRRGSARAVSGPASPSEGSGRSRSRRSPPRTPWEHSGALPYDGRNRRSLPSRRSRCRPRRRGNGTGSSSGGPAPRSRRRSPSRSPEADRVPELLPRRRCPPGRISKYLDEVSSGERARRWQSIRGSRACAPCRSRRRRTTVASASGGLRGPRRTASPPWSCATGCSCTSR